MKCKHCDQEFYAKPYEVKHGRKYCSRVCFLDNKHKVREAEYPQIRQCKGCDNDFVVESSRRRAKKYCSQSCAAKQSNRGRKGIKYTCTMTFRNKLLAKYGRCCAVCVYDKFVAAHHIVGRANGGNNEIGNGILLCPNHHAEADAGLLTEEYLKMKKACLSQSQSSQSSTERLPVDSV